MIKDSHELTRLCNEVGEFDIYDGENSHELTRLCNEVGEFGLMMEKTLMN
jgi:hypothetical protein